MIYADNAATTKLAPEALEAMLPFLRDLYANPSGLYSFSRTSKKVLRESRETIAACIGALPEEIVFTSGGSESDNWAIKGVCLANGNNSRYIITSSIEHHAVLNACKSMEQMGYQIVYLPVDFYGHVALNEFRNAVQKTPAIASIMLANNEIGTIEDIKPLSDVAHEFGSVFHADAVQAVGHIPVDVNALGIDLLSASAHKFNGPKGIGFLYIRKGTNITNLIDGGQQEFAQRAGTENVASIVGMSVALKSNCEQMQKNIDKLHLLEKTFKQTIIEHLHEAVFNGDSQQHLPGLISLSLPDCSGESLLHILDLKGVAVSTGAACNSKTTEISHVLKAIKHTEDLAKGTLRVSFGKYNSVAEAEQVAKIIGKYAGMKTMQKN